MGEWLLSQLIVTDMTFEEIVKQRRSIRRFDKDFNFDFSAIDRSLELAILAPNSSNLQLWEFHVIKSEDKLTQMIPMCMGQGSARTASAIVAFVTCKQNWKKHAKWNIEKISENIIDLQNLSKLEKRGLDYYKKIIPLFYDNFPWPLKTMFRQALVWGMQIMGKPMMRIVGKSDQRVVGHKSTALAAQTFMLAIENEDYGTCPMEGFDEKMVKKLLKLNSSFEITMLVAVGKALPEGISNERWRLPRKEVVFEH